MKQIYNEFTNYAKMNEMRLKTTLESELKAIGYDVHNEKGFLFAKGEIPVLLVAHLDTVHQSLPTEINCKKDIVSSPQGIGGDDRCGTWIIMDILKANHRPSVVFCEQEEIGCRGAKEFAKSKYIKELEGKINYIIEFDRRGNGDAVFYNCENKDFVKFIEKETGFKEAWGSCSDISYIAPAMKVAAVNLSSGYYSEHTKGETVVLKDMKHTAEVAKKLLQKETENPQDKPFEYIERKSLNYTYNSNLWDLYRPQKKSKRALDVWDRAVDDCTYTLEVIYEDPDTYEELTDYAYGFSREAAWLNFFAEHPYICFGNVFDFNWY